MLITGALLCSVHACLYCSLDTNTAISPHLFGIMFSLKLVVIWCFSTQKALASGAEPQTPMGELAALPHGGRGGGGGGGGGTLPAPSPGDATTSFYFGNCPFYSLPTPLNCDSINCIYTVTVQWRRIHISLSNLINELSILKLIIQKTECVGIIDHS